jgi:CheY-like chemotaxis protein
MLTGQKTLVVEEEFLIALDIQRVLEEHKVGQCVFARSSEEALEQRARWSEYALAIVELRASQPANLELLRGLDAAGVNLIITTSDLSQRAGLLDLPNAPTLIKPFPEAELMSAISKALIERA